MMDQEAENGFEAGVSYKVGDVVMINQEPHRIIADGTAEELEQGRGAVATEDFVKRVVEAEIGLSLIHI